MGRANINLIVESVSVLANYFLYFGILMSQDPTRGGRSALKVFLIYFSKQTLLEVKILEKKVFREIQGSKKVVWRSHFLPIFGQTLVLEAIGILEHPKTVVRGQSRILDMPKTVVWGHSSKLYMPKTTVWEEIKR